MPIQEFSASSLPEYTELAASFVQKWSHDDTGEVAPWYRGQSQASWQLVPGEYRFPIVNPDEIRSEFILKATDLLPRVPATEWEWYFIMQHYGLPTRLLDWTTGSLIALHFALCTQTAEQDAAVWVLDPWDLNSRSLGSGDLLLSTDTQADRYLPPLYGSGRIPARPIAIVPPYNSPRITVQRGAFTVHGSSTRPLDDQFKSRLARIVLPSSAALRLRRQLRTAGISEFTLFPELEGLARDIKAQHVEGC